MEIYDLGPAIAQRRKALGITQEALCKELHLSRVTISAFETGKKLSLSLRQLGHILKRLGLELDIKERSNTPTLDDLLN